MEDTIGWKTQLNICVMRRAQPIYTNEIYCQNPSFPKIDVIADKSV